MRWFEALRRGDFRWDIFPKDIPRGLIFLLMGACVLLGLSGLREGVGQMLFQWLFMLVLVPLATTLLAVPIKWRDPSFELKMAYYLGMFVALLFTLAKLRYWR